MVMLISAGAILIAGTFLGIGGWLTEPNHEVGLPMFILAGIVGIAGGIGLPAAIAAALGSGIRRMGPRAVSMLGEAAIYIAGLVGIPTAVTALHPIISWKGQGALRSG